MNLTSEVGHVLAPGTKNSHSLPVAVSLKLFGGAEGDRTPDLRIANAALCQTELLPHATKNTVSSFEFQVMKNPQISQITGRFVSGASGKILSNSYASRSRFMAVPPRAGPRGL